MTASGGLWLTSRRDCGPLGGGSNADDPSLKSRDHESGDARQVRERNGLGGPDEGQRLLGNTAAGLFGVELAISLRHGSDRRHAADVVLGAVRVGWALSRRADGVVGGQRPRRLQQSAVWPLHEKLLPKAKEEAKRGFTSVLLLPLRVTRAFRAHILTGAARLLFWDARLTFFENGVPRLNEKQFQKGKLGAIRRRLIRSSWSISPWRASDAVLIHIWAVPPHVTREDLKRAAERKRSCLPHDTDQGERPMPTPSTRKKTRRSRRPCIGRCEEDCMRAPAQPTDGATGTARQTAKPRDPEDQAGRHSVGPSRRRRSRGLRKPLFLSDEETAVVLGISRRTVNSLASSGRLIAIHPEGIRARRFAWTDVKALADQWIVTPKGSRPRSDTAETVRLPRVALYRRMVRGLSCSDQAVPHPPGDGQ